MKSRWISLIFSVLGMAVLTLDSAHALVFAAEGINLCLRTVIPSLFPFFVLSIFLTGNLTGSGGMAAILIPGFLGGYPVGAQSAAEAWRTGRLSREAASGMLMFCSQAGPAFLFGLVSAQFPEKKYVWLLWGIQLLSAMSVALLVPGLNIRKTPKQAPLPITLPDAMRRSLRAMGSVCGWIVIFRVLLGYTAFLPLGNIQRVLLTGLLELSNGCLALGTVDNIRIRLLLAAVMLNFGGICVLLQTASVIQGLPLKNYLLGKLLQTLFALLCCLGFLGCYGALIPVVGVFLLFGRKNPGKRSSIPAPFGV